ncbi:MAG: two-component system response regulator [Gallionellales bacterium GWA2_59_43]|nr:MAG: two-component system response regulator [Gallionellales bacterium GWA2_59_43]
MSQGIPPVSAGRVLLVDDEANILAALRRLLRMRGYEVFSANSGAEGLAMLELEKIDVIISDMKMPEMTGAEFLERTFLKWPDVKRILLTGHSDVNLTIAAINRGKIWRYIAKPWDEEDLVLTIQQAIAHRQLMFENARLLSLTQSQNEELKSLNTTLEARVNERTQQLQQALKTLRQSFVNSVQVFSNMIEMRGGVLAGHSRRVAEHARNVAKHFRLEEAEVQEIFLAALLHDIGKLGLPDEAIERPFNSLGPKLRAEVMKHPSRGELLLMPIEQLAGVAVLIRHHHEQFDGGGYPSGKSGIEIPLGSRILAVVNDYDALQLGLMSERRLPRAEALRYLVENRGKRYDPSVVDAFSAVLAKANPEEFVEMPLRPVSLHPGYRLTRDLLHREGYLLLAKDHVLSANEITQLVRLEEVEAHPITVYVAT